MAKSFILLNCNKNQDKEIIARLREISEVKEIQCVTGPFNILVKAEASTIEELNEIITWKIRKIKNVRSTYTLKINEEATDCKDDNS